MPRRVPSEPVHADINWSEKDNKSNSRNFATWFEDIQSGSAKAHVRALIDGPGDFIALVEPAYRFEMRCKLDIGLTVLAADVATPHGKTTYSETLSQRP
ncbi:MAG: hypothetical protein WEA77_05850 [Hyphomonas sp.]|uniref:hypothetical protein n=1 Tax=Hyphomonas sp. TaxID=87 RepID=UPI0034A05A37